MGVSTQSTWGAAATMNPDNLKLASVLIGETYAQQGASSIRMQEKLVQNLLTQRCLPPQGWDDESIELFLHQLSLMDSNNFKGNVGAGEREARVYSSLVARRNYYMAHGIGRSGDVMAVQPKAAGSSLIVQLTNYMAAHALKLAGMQKMRCHVLPLATGMTITVSLLAMKNNKKQAQYVLWPRIDQKTCLKAMLSTGLTPVPIENVLEGDMLRTDLEAIEAKIQELGAENVLAIVTTSSCFSPRVPDKLVEIAEICKKNDIGHLINNAYGVQAASTTQLIGNAIRKGRVDVIVQSTDKNFMVPVGGAILAAPANSSKLLDEISAAYPGRASAAPIHDLFITFLSMGEAGWKGLLQQRKTVYKSLQEGLTQLATKHGERVLNTKSNPISFAMSLNGMCETEKERSEITFLGAMLFSRNISGARVVSGLEHKKVGPFEFDGFGAHSNCYPVPYLNAAAAIGMTEEDVSTFLARLEITLTEFGKKRMKARAEHAPAAGEDVESNIPTMSAIDNNGEGRTELIAAPPTGDEDNVEP